MRSGEVSSYTVRSDYAYGWEGKPPKIPVDATLRFEIELLSWSEAAKPVFDMSHAEKKSHGMAQREEGTKLLRGTRYEEAAVCFESAIESLGALHALMLQGRPDPAKMREVSEALRSCLLNLSQCQLKTEQWEAAAGDIAPNDVPTNLTAKRYAEYGLVAVAAVEAATSSDWAGNERRRRQCVRPRT